MTYFIKYEQRLGPTATSHVFLVSRVFPALPPCRGAAGFFLPRLYMDLCNSLDSNSRKVTPCNSLDSNSRKVTPCNSLDSQLISIPCNSFHNQLIFSVQLVR